MDDIGARMLEAEKSIKDLLYRMGNVEDEAKGAWKAINDVNKHIIEMNARIDSLEMDVKSVKEYSEKSS